MRALLCRLGLHAWSRWRMVYDAFALAAVPPQERGRMRRVCRRCSRIQES